MTVIALGEVVVDWLAVQPGETMLTAHQFYRDVGGNATNVSIGLSRLGNHVWLIAKMGADFHGKFLRRRLEEEKIDLSHLVIDSRYPTAQCYITTSAEGNHEFANWPRPHAADMLMPEELPEEAFQRAHILHTTGISMMREPRRLAVVQAAELAQKHKVIFCFDGSFPTGAGLQARSLVEEMLFRADVLKVNKQEALFWSNETDESVIGDGRQIGRQLFQRYGPKVLLLTLGAQGALVLTSKMTVRCAPIPVTPVSEVGSGDAFIAGFLHVLLNELGGANNGKIPGADLSDLSAEFCRRAGTSGNIAGALATRSVSAYDGLPSHAEWQEWMGKVPLNSALD